MNNRYNDSNIYIYIYIYTHNDYDNHDNVNHDDTSNNTSYMHDTNTNNNNEAGGPIRNRFESLASRRGQDKLGVYLVGQDKGDPEKRALV